MQEIVISVKRVTGIMSEIAAASQEQSQGIEQVNKAITQMDDVTQRNAALVEQAAAAAESMTEQTLNLAQAVAKFNIGRSAAASSGARRPDEAQRSRQPARPAAERRGPGRMADVARLPGRPVSGSGHAGLSDQKRIRSV